MSDTTDYGTTFWGPEYGITSDSELRIRYGMYDGMYEGDDWEYVFKFDVKNTAAFLAQIPVKNDAKSISEYMKENFDSQSRLIEFCKKHGIHGTETHYGEFPPAVFGPYEF